jgi:predicted nucleic acid-binding protein
MSLVLDAGAFIAFERGDASLRATLLAARRLELDLTTTAPVVAQVWRSGRRQAMVARLLAASRIDAPDESAARRAGELLARTKTSDVVDALLVDLVKSGDCVLTSDPRDLEPLLAASAKSAAIVPL